MGTDYESRKRNKRLNKRAGREAAEDSEAKSKRQRTKGRPKVGFCCVPCCSRAGVPRDRRLAACWSASIGDEGSGTKPRDANGTAVIVMTAHISIAALFLHQACCRPHAQVRRLCQGACYGDPKLTEDDAQWRDSEDEAPAAWSAPAEDLLQPADDAGKPGAQLRKLLACRLQ